MPDGTYFVVVDDGDVGMVDRRTDVTRIVVRIVDVEIQLHSECKDTNFSMNTVPTAT